MDDKRDNPSHQDLPGSVSNQNREEAEPGHGGGEERRDGSDARRHRSGDKGSAGGSGEGSGGEPGQGSGGESGEGSQSTGDPRSAG